MAPLSISPLKKETKKEGEITIKKILKMNREKFKEKKRRRRRRRATCLVLVPGWRETQRGIRL